MNLYYVATSNGCTIRLASSLAAAIRKVCKDVGENNVRHGRKATAKDIAWVRGMGGHVPKLGLSENGRDGSP